MNRDKKLTKTERNLKLLKRMRRDAQEELRKEKHFNKDINKLNIFIKDHEKKLGTIEEGIKKRKAERDVERLRQETTGYVERPTQIGRIKYKMRKTDFQDEEELAGSLRTIKTKATPADLLVERYDSVFRRNLIEPEVPIGGDRRRSGKAKYKWHNSRGGTGAEKLNA